MLYNVLRSLLFAEEVEMQREFILNVAFHGAPLELPCD